MTETRSLFVGPAPRLHLLAAGRGPLVVCLHGIGGGAASWRRQLACLEKRFTVAAWDARGYGASDDYDGPLTFGDFCGDLERVLDHFGVGTAHLVGHSMGGRIALAFEARHPDRVATLTLVDTGAGSTKIQSPEEIERFLAARKKPLLDGKTPRDIAPQVAASVTGPNTPPDVRADVIELLASLRTDSYLKTLDAVTRHPSFPDFERLAVPVHVMVGEHDAIVSPEYAADMARRIPQARFTLLPGASHVSNMDGGLAFDAALLSFLQDHAARADAPAAVRAWPP